MENEYLKNKFEEIFGNYEKYENENTGSDYKLLWEGFLAGYNVIEHALILSLQHQSHYADLLNMHDGGKRLQFNSIEEWLEKLYKEE